jgi:hypothetical protein
MPEKALSLSPDEIPACAGMTIKKASRPNLPSRAAARASTTS